jgi:hypothetical protein
MKLSGENEWCMWMYEAPPFGALIQICREEWEEPSLAKREDCRPELNIYGLYWRLTGIGRMYLASHPVRTAYQQMNGYKGPVQMGSFMSNLLGMLGEVGDCISDAGLIEESR